MSREVKVNLAVEMSSTVYHVTMDSVRDRHPGISESKLFHLTKRRIHRRPPIWIEDAVPYFSQVGRPKLSGLAHAWKMTHRDTGEVLKGLKRLWSRWHSEPNRLD